MYYKGRIAVTNPSIIVRDTWKKRGDAGGMLANECGYEGRSKHVVLSLFGIITSIPQ